MLNAELYGKLEREFIRCRVGEEVEDVLLELAEAISDKGVMGKEITVEKQAGRGKLAACGICQEGEEGEEPSVCIKTLAVNGKEFEIEDYIL